MQNFLIILLMIGVLTSSACENCEYDEYFIGKWKVESVTLYDHNGDEITENSENIDDAYNKFIEV